MSCDVMSHYITLHHIMFQTVERVILSLMTITTGISLLPYLLYHTTPNHFCQGLALALAAESEQQECPLGSDTEAIGQATGQASGLISTFSMDSRSVGLTGEGLYYPVNSSLGLFVSIAIVLAVHSFCLVYMTITRKEQQKGVGNGDSYHLYLLEHQFTSPDAPVKAPDESIPQRSVLYCVAE
jgi:hypothetical protein